MKGWGVFNGIEGKFLAEVRKVGRGVAQKIRSSGLDTRNGNIRGIWTGSVTLYSWELSH